MEAVVEVEKKVTDIRAWYNDTQKDLSSFETSDDNGMKKYYNSSGELVRTDVTGKGNTYTRFYYFRNNKLYFAFIFDGTKENRIYFYGNTMFRWIDESKVTHDNEFTNDMYMYWANFAFEEVKNIR